MVLAPDLSPTTTIALTPAQEQRAVALHRDAVLVDCSSVIKQEPAHIERARAGAVTVTNHTVVRPPSDLATALGEINMCRRWIQSNPSDVLLVTSVEDIDTAKRTNREGIILGPQNTEFIGTDIAYLGTAYDLGVRILQLTYQRQNWVGSGCGEERDGGLSTFGRQLVREMDSLGMVVDLSHCGAQTAEDAIRTSRHPVIFSHAHPNRLSPHVRAKDDDLLRALAAQGGVIGITALSAFLYDPAQPRVRQGLPRFVEHLKYLVDLIGIDHVGVGLDFDETNTPEKYRADHEAHPELSTGWSWDDKRIHDLTSAAEETNLTRALVWGGFSDGEARKILGENFQRVFKTVWRS
jgi:membrane dipeptidase